MQAGERCPFKSPAYEKFGFPARIKPTQIHFWGGDGGGDSTGSPAVVDISHLSIWTGQYIKHDNTWDNIPLMGGRKPEKPYFCCFFLTESMWFDLRKASGFPLSKAGIVPRLMVSSTFLNVAGFFFSWMKDILYFWNGIVLLTLFDLLIAAPCFLCFNI